jgi:[acyl-carrier-protein] S-malonyltransferase
VVEEVCAAIDGIVVAANYNCPGQLVTQEKHCCRGSLCCDERGGAKRALLLPVVLFTRQ